MAFFKNQYLKQIKYVVGCGYLNFVLFSTVAGSMIGITNGIEDTKNIEKKLTKTEIFGEVFKIAYLGFSGGIAGTLYGMYFPVSIPLSLYISYKEN